MSAARTSTRIQESDDAIGGSSVQAAAHVYAARGWFVFPAPPGKKKSYKSAEYSGGRKWGKTSDPAEIEFDWKRWPDANVAIVTGAESDIFVLETDTPKGRDVDGAASLAVLEEQHGPLPETLMAESPSGSRHRYFNWPKGLVIKNSASKLGPGIDSQIQGIPLSDWRAEVARKPQTRAGEYLRSRFPVPPSHADLIAALPGLGSAVDR